MKLQVLKGILGRDWAEWKWREVSTSNPPFHVTEWLLPGTTLDKKEIKGSTRHR